LSTAELGAPLRILLVAPVPTHPSETGASARVRYMAAALERLGHEVHFLHLQQPFRMDDRPLREAWADRLHVCRPLTPRSFLGRGRRKLVRIVGKTLHLDLPVDSYHDPEAARSLAELTRGGRFDVVILSYVFYSRLLEDAVAPIRKIIDTHDVFSDRFRLYREHGQASEFFSTSRSEEAKALDRADAVLAIQEWDAGHFRSLTRRPVAVVGHLAPVAFDPIASRPSPAGPAAPVVLFVGGPMRINVHGVTWFIERVLPAVRRRVPGAELWLAGGIGRRIRSSAPGLRRLGFVDRLADAYRQAAVVINPQQFGTGLSIKSVDALLHGRPLVTTASGGRGLEEGAGEAFRQATDPEDYAEQVAGLLLDPARAAALAACGLEFARGYHERMVRALAEVVRSPARSQP
jgi:glycosyltransferase involved in cell wall biosynthesis